ncbi:hypothetical protein [Streptomyces sp. MI02-7b]|uniref:hypothetical protein n=1 Tax=Streptomyces sp. MI02-7b TaxID=462941 RepID=UPI0029AD05B2|nr:hypothetical protein [Streptomyces sp. MI02-7b]MDX3074601.1 hypothetical protein [Streptomyces sp. MI02-7b]
MRRALLAALTIVVIAGATIAAISALAFLAGHDAYRQATRPTPSPTPNPPPQEP